MRNQSLRIIFFLLEQRKAIFHLLGKLSHPASSAVMALVLGAEAGSALHSSHPQSSARELGLLVMLKALGSHLSSWLVRPKVTQQQTSHWPASPLLELPVGLGL